MDDKPRGFSRLQIAEATAAAVLASAIITTAGGMFWLVVTLPNRLQAIETQTQQLLKTVGVFDTRFEQVETQLNDHDRRIVKLEVRQR